MPDHKSFNPKLGHKLGQSQASGASGMARRFGAAEPGPGPTPLKDEGVLAMRKPIFTVQEARERLREVKAGKAKRGRPKAAGEPPWVKEGLSRSAYYRRHKAKKPEGGK